MASLAVATARGQQYRVDEPDAAAKRNASVAIASVKNAARYSADREKFEDYFKNYYFKDMTQSGPDDLADLGDTRYNLFKRYLWSTNNEQLQQHLTDLAYQSMRQMVAANSPPYHPAVRYNAVLVLGMLDDQYAIEAAANRRPPRPHSASRQLLVQIVKAAVDDRPVPPVLVLASLIGLERHAQYSEGMTPADTQAMTATMLQLVSRDEPLEEMDRETHDWLRLRAAGVLAQLGSVGENNAVHDAIIKLVAEMKSLDDRTEIASKLGQLEYEGAQVDGKAAVETIFALAREVGEAESERAEDFQNAYAGLGGGGGRFGGPMGMPRGEMMFGAGGSGEEEETFPRRHVLARLIDLRTALRAIKPTVDEVTQGKVDDVLKAIQPVISAAADEDTVELKVASSIHSMAAGIDRAAAPAAEPALDEQEAAEF